MKRIFLLMFPLAALWSCGVEDYPELEPYIFFANNIDEYIVDPAYDYSYTITGSLNAEGEIYSITMGDLQYSEDQIGAGLTTYPFEYEVDLSNFKESMDVRFEIVDKRGMKTEKVFHFKAAAPIETFEVDLVAQAMETGNFFYSFTDKKGYSLTEFTDSKTNDNGFCFGFDIVRKEAMLLSPTALVTMNILADTKGTQTVTFGLVEGLEKSSFDNISNNAAIRNLNGPSYRTFEYASVAKDKVYLCKSIATDKWGLIYIDDLVSGVAGTLKATVKMEK